MIDPTSIGGWIVAAAAGGMAAFERLQTSRVAKKTNQETEVVSEAKAWQARAQLFEKMASDSQTLLEKEYAAHQATRDYHHGQVQEHQSELLKCNERCADLQTKTDISKVESLLLEQGKVLMTVGEGIRELLINHK